MRQPKFTPGPWRSGKSHHAVVASTNDGLTVSGSYCEDGREHYGGYLIAESVSKCNTDLIASAPEMYKALEQGIDAVSAWLEMDECDCPGEGHICGRPLRERQLEQMQSALRKARGEYD